MADQAEGIVNLPTHSSVDETDHSSAIDAAGKRRPDLSR